MKCYHHANDPFPYPGRISSSDIGVVVESRLIEVCDKTDVIDNCPIHIDRNSFEMSLDGRTYPIAMPLHVPYMSSLYVREKWEYPYWKKNGLGYLPHDDNPIGNRLIILADQMSDQKVPYGIHVWPRLPRTDFRQGNFGNGCIRMRESDIQEFFDMVNLGTSVYID